MRQIIIPISVIASLIALTSLYNKTQNNNRVVRQATDIDDNDDQVLSFLSNEDDEMLQLGRAGKKKGNSNKVSLASISKCLKTESCYGEAIKIPEKNALNTIAALAAADMVSEVHADENKLESTDDDGTVTATFESETGLKPVLGVSELNTQVLTSTRMGFDIADGNNGGFEAGDALFVFILPSGIPLTAPFDGAKDAYAAFWRFIRLFTSKYVDPYASAKGRKSMSLWTAREDKKVSWSLPKPAKISRRFPYDRFTRMLGSPIASAYQPYMMKSFNTLYNSLRDHASSKAASHDCYVVWFHQYLPIDIAQFLDPTNADLIEEFNSMCSVIHIWVGFNTPAQKQAVAKLQSLIQPEQKQKTNADPNLRGYFVLDNHLDIVAEDSNGNYPFMRTIYQNMVVERNRVACHMAVPSYVYPVVASDDAFTTASTDGETTGSDDYVGTTVPSGEDVAATAESVEEATMVPTETVVTDSFVEDIKLNDGVIDTGVAAEPDIVCCGIGMNGVSYDANTSSCCDDGKVAKFNAEDGSDMCI